METAFAKIASSQAQQASVEKPHVTPAFVHRWAYRGHLIHPSCGTQTSEDDTQVVCSETTSGLSRLGNPCSDDHYLGRPQGQKWAFCKCYLPWVSRTSLWQQARSGMGHLPSGHASFICEHMELLNCH